MSDDNVDALIALPEVRGMIEAVAHRAGIQHGVGYLDADDVKAELTAVAALLAKSFDPSRGHKFTTFLWPRLNGRAIDLRRRYGRQKRGYEGANGWVNGPPRPIEVPLLQLDVDDQIEDIRLPSLALLMEAISTDDSECAADIDGAIASLPANERAVILLREYGGIAAKGIAEMLGCPIVEAKVLRRHAVRRLRVGLMGS